MLLQGTQLSSKFPYGGSSPPLPPVLGTHPHTHKIFKKEKQTRRGPPLSPPKPHPGSAWLPGLCTSRPLRVPKIASREITSSRWHYFFRRGREVRKSSCRLLGTPSPHLLLLPSGHSSHLCCCFALRLLLAVCPHPLPLLAIYLTFKTTLHSCHRPFSRTCKTQRKCLAQSDIQAPPRYGRPAGILLKRLLSPRFRG